jgi:hypothetical protein
MALRECEDCTTLFAVGLETCPACKSGNHHEHGAKPKPKRRPAAKKPKPK